MLGRLLEDRLGKVVPPGFQVAYSEDGLLRYTSDPGRFPGQTGTYQAGAAGTYVRDNFTLWGETDPERVVGACRQALDELQDYVDEASHTPWPDERTPPRPFAELRGAEVVWGGAPDAPVLECEPIPVERACLPSCCGASSRRGLYPGRMRGRKLDSAHRHLRSGVAH